MPCHLQIGGSTLKWGIYKLLITSADMNAFLGELAADGVTIYNIRILDELAAEICVEQQNFQMIEQLAERCGCVVNVVARIGLIFRLQQVLKRPVLLMGVFLWLFLVLFLPSRVLFVRVEGNETIPALLIEEKAANYGVAFGSARRNLRNEKIKNALLAELPDLQWVGVNTQGCLAVISVRERAVVESPKEKTFIGHIIASQDGIISDIAVTKGTPLCETGQAVIKDQILVSGYTDCGLVTRAEVAEAEVSAITKRYLTAKQMTNCTARNQIIDTETVYSIQIGKNILKFSNNAGIPDGNCAKIYNRIRLTLPGGFCLPLSLICEKTVRYEQSNNSINIDEKEQEFLAEVYLDEQMLAGHIVSSHYQRVITEDACELKGLYICEEVIGQLRKEEIGK